MIVECISTDYKSCQENSALMNFLFPNENTNSSGSLPLDFGELYLVVAFAFGPFVPWLFIADRSGLSYPSIFPVTLFSIIDSRISRFWDFGFWEDWQGGKHTLLALNRWAKDSLFHGKLFEGDTEALSFYEDQLNMLTIEFSLPWIEEKAISLGNDCWVTDKDYNESWESDPLMEMTIHPKTRQLMHNPVFQRNSLISIPE